MNCWLLSARINQAVHKDGKARVGSRRSESVRGNGKVPRISTGESEVDWLKRGGCKISGPKVSGSASLRGRKEGRILKVASKAASDDRLERVTVSNQPAGRKAFLGKFDILVRQPPPPSPESSPGRAKSVGGLSLANPPGPFLERIEIMENKQLMASAGWCEGSFGRGEKFFKKLRKKRLRITGLVVVSPNRPETSGVGDRNGRSQHVVIGFFVP